MAGKNNDDRDDDRDQRDDIDDEDEDDLDDDVEDDEDEDEDDADGKGKDGKGKDEWKPPTREEWERTQRALTRVKKESATRRRKLSELRNGAGKKDDADEDRKREEAAAEKYKPAAIRSAAKAAFLEAGLVLPEGDRGKARLARMIRQLDMSDLEIDDDGDVIGLDDQVDEIRDEFPELFKGDDEDGGDGGKKRTTTRLSGAGKKDAKPVKSSAERLAAQLTG